LFAYAFGFSLAYVSLSTGMGALILFGAVQATMIGSGLWSGERLHVMQWVGLVAALGGLAWLVWPGISAPDPIGALLMGISGIAWGYYSIRGRGGRRLVARRRVRRHYLGAGLRPVVKALRSLTTQAAVLQLLVPVLAAAAGVAFLAEVVSLRLVTASAFILGASPWPF